MEETAKPRVREEEGVQEEVGATAGRTHREVLEQTLGPERAHDVLAAGGPSPVPERRNHPQK